MTAFMLIVAQGTMLLDNSFKVETSETSSALVLLAFFFFFFLFFPFSLFYVRLSPRQTQNLVGQKFGYTFSLEFRMQCIFFAVETQADLKGWTEALRSILTARDKEDLNREVRFLSLTRPQIHTEFSRRLLSYSHRHYFNHRYSKRDAYSDTSISTATCLCVSA